MAAPLSPKLDWVLANPLWAQTLNPVINSPIIQGIPIFNISLSANTPRTINHSLGRMMIGWFPIDNTANCAVWRTQSFNSSTITVEASAATTISMWVF